MKPLTLERAKKLRVGDIVYHKTNKNRDRTPQRWRVNGEVKRWKRDKDRIKIPVKYGLYTYGYIDNSNINLCMID